MTFLIVVSIHGVGITMISNGFIFTNMYFLIFLHSICGIGGQETASFKESWYIFLAVGNTVGRSQGDLEGKKLSDYLDRKPKSSTALGIAALPGSVEVFAWTGNRPRKSKSWAGSVSSAVHGGRLGKQGDPESENLDGVTQMNQGRIAQAKKTSAYSDK